MIRDLLRSLPPLALLAGACAWHPAVAAASLEVRVLDERGAGLEHAVVSLHGDAPRRAAPGTSTTMDQRARQFAPTVVALQAGTDVRFPNSDDVRHHVYSFSHPNAFELKLYHGEESRPVRFDEPGIVVLGCNIHDGMIGYLHVVDTPFFAKSTPDGETRIDGVPAGDWTLQVWHPDLGIRYFRQEVAVRDEGTRLILTLDGDAVDGAALGAARPLASPSGEPAPDEALSRDLQSLFRDD